MNRHSDDRSLASTPFGANLKSGSGSPGGMTALPLEEFFDVWDPLALV